MHAFASKLQYSSAAVSRRPKNAPYTTGNIKHNQQPNIQSSDRIHTDSKAADTAQSVQAKAFTLDNNIVFNTGQYSPDDQASVASHNYVALLHTMAIRLMHISYEDIRC